MISLDVQKLFSLMQFHFFVLLLLPLPEEKDPNHNIKADVQEFIVHVSLWEGYRFKALNLGLESILSFLGCMV